MFPLSTYVYSVTIVTEAPLCGHGVVYRGVGMMVRTPCPCMYVAFKSDLFARANHLTHQRALTLLNLVSWAVDISVGDVDYLGALFIGWTEDPTTTCLKMA